MIELIGDVDNFNMPAAIVENADGTWTAYIRLATIEYGHLIVRSTQKNKGKACNSVIKKMQSLTTIYNELLAETIHPIYIAESDEALKKLVKELGYNDELPKLTSGNKDN